MRSAENKIEDKKKKNNKVKKEKSTVLKSFIGFLKGSWGYIIGAAVFMLLGVFTNYLIPQIAGFTIDNLIGGEPIPAYLEGLVKLLGGVDFLKNNIYIMGLLVIGISAFQALFAFLRRVTTLNGSEKVAKHIKDKVFTHIQRLPFAWHSSIQTGDIIQRATQDTDLIKRYVGNQFTELFRLIAMLGLGLILMFFMNVKMTLIAMIFIPPTLIFSIIYFPKIAKNYLKTDIAEGQLTALLQENLTGIRVVRAFGKQSDEMKRYEKQNKDYVSLWTRFGHKLSVFWGSGDMFAGLQTLAIIIAGTYMAVSGEMKVGQILVFISYNQMLIWPVRNLGRILAETGKVKASVQRLEEILKAKTEVVLNNEAEPEICGEIEFRNVGFSYNDSRKILDDVSFRIPRGSTFGIIGGTGSGKSTIIQLINRLYDPTEGEILIDGTDAKDIKREHLRKNIGIILQEPFLFSRKFVDNVTIAAKDEPDMADIQKYIAISSLESTVEELSDGLDTIVGEKGVTLSGGQKQRLVIARTLIQKPAVVVFDDSLSAVDTDTDFKIRQALQQNLGDTTVILISHRITSLMHADNIMVLSGGRIEDIGSHRELIKREGTYKRLYDLQTNIEAEEKERDHDGIAN